MPGRVRPLARVLVGVLNAVIQTFAIVVTVVSIAADSSRDLRRFALAVTADM